MGDGGQGVEHVLAVDAHLAGEHEVVEALDHGHQGHRRDLRVDTHDVGLVDAGDEGGGEAGHHVAAHAPEVGVAGRRLRPGGDDGLVVLVQMAEAVEPGPQLGVAVLVGPDRT